ncbi:MAG TPA: septum formation protein Maf [Flavobacteriaceae bacterium]|jgi:septum formation protein|nr:septum formation protein Maf [Flavobacteriaceae bacterium]HBS12613.1 septum formation protein Maf [Flavobacteriaceae bacterium]
MLINKLKNHKLLLASKSPRRQQFLKNLGLEFTTVSIDVEEIYPKYLHGNEITCFLAELKADAYKNTLKSDEILITADTIVRVSGKILGKPKDADDAKKMLQLLSDTQHEVITSVCIKTQRKTKIINDTTSVKFKKLTDEEIDFYIENFKPFDKAGAYGIQEWIGFIGVKKIEGSFYTVVGFPVHKFYKEMMKF